MFIRNIHSIISQKVLIKKDQLYNIYYITLDLLWFNSNNIKHLFLN